ncbi:hypothetical protein AAHB54_14345 [Bacillus cereus]
MINENGIEHPQICYVPEVDPIQTCDTCIVEADGEAAHEKRGKVFTMTMRKHVTWFVP